MRFFKNLGVFSNKTQAAKGFQPKKVSQQTFILEPLITPSGLVDSVDHAPHPLEIDLHTTILPEVHLPDLDTDHTLDHAVSDTVETHATTESIHHPVEQTTYATTLDELNLHSAAHDQIIATHIIETPIADHQLEVLPFLHSTSATPVVAPSDTTFTSGVFTVGDSGKISIDYLFDGGQYQGQLAIFNLDGMEQYQPGSHEFIHEAASRSLSNSNFGHVVMSDAAEGARFSGLMGGELQNWNTGEYQGVHTFSMRPGEHFGIMLVPNGTVQEVFEHPGAEGAIHPLFSMSTANPNDAFHLGQIADVTNNGHTFVMEDLRVDSVSDHDYNDLVFQVRGATGTAIHLDDVIDHSHDWRTTDMGQALIDYAKPYDHPADVTTVTPSIEAPPVIVTSSVDTSLTLADTQGVKFHFPHAQQPLIGVIDTGFSADNPDINYTHITLGHDYVAGDDNPLLQPTEGSEHGTHVLGVIAGTNDNGIGIDGINDQAPIWVGRATGSGHWADSLVDFVNHAQVSGQPHAVVNLSLDLTQINHDGSVTTRYEFTPVERAAIEYARQHDVLIVVAAGNDGGVMSALGQSSQEFDNIITVGASDGVDRADYSSFGHGLDILAPGGTIEHPVLSTVGDGVGTMAGTSVATAEVTGAASQVWAANPDLSYRQVIELLKLTATDVSTPNWDVDTGAGLLNIAAAVQLGLVTAPEAYKPDSFSTPTTWGGEGQVKPIERAADFNGQIQNKTAVQINGGVNIRSGPGTSYSQVGKISPGGTLTFDRETQGELVIDPNGDGSSSTWYHLADGRGWMSAVYIQKNSAPTPTPTPSPKPTPTPTPTSITINGYTISGSFYPVFQNYRGTLGNPTSGVLNSANGVSYQLFQNGSIVSSKYGTFPIFGGIRKAYLNTGGLDGWLGAPKSGEIGQGNGVIIQYFANGYIIWNGSKATAYQTGSGTPSKPVPPSTPLTLIRTGGGDSLEEYRRKIKALQDDIDDLNRQIKDKQKEAEKKDNEAKGKEWWTWLPWIKDEYEKLRKEADQIRKEISELESKKKKKEQEVEQARKELENSARVTAFLDTIAYAEGTYKYGDDSYKLLFGFGKFDSFDDHPRIYIPFFNKAKGRMDTSTAAGRYQITNYTWDGIKSKLGLKDFSPENQDLAAIELLKQRKAYADVEAGNFEEAVKKVRQEWASLPGAGYSQPEKSMNELKQFYQDRLKQYIG